MFALEDDTQDQYCPEHTYVTREDSHMGPNAIRGNSSHIGVLCLGHNRTYDLRRFPSFNFGLLIQERLLEFGTWGGFHFMHLAHHARAAYNVRRTLSSAYGS